MSAFEATVAVAGKRWYDTADASVAAAWQRFAGEVGVYRAIHLMRRAASGTGPAGDAWKAQAGKFLGLPEQVSVFAVAAGTAVRIATGNPVAAAVAANPESIQSNGWMMSFAHAEQVGMGVRVSDSTAVSNALKAEWIIAVGTHDADRTAELEAAFEDAIAHGRFEFIDQDASTNNTDLGLTPYESTPSDAVSALERATTREGAVAATNLDADVLGRALGVSSVLLRGAGGAARRTVSNAGAMMRALLPGLIDATFDSIAPDGMTRSDLVEFLASWATARGPLPVVRFGADPFGVLPVGVDLDPPAPQADPASARTTYEFVREIARAGDESVGSAVSARSPIAPGDAAAGEKLRAILQSCAVSIRIDVIDAGSKADPKLIACPYIASSNHKPVDYLRILRHESLAALPNPNDGNTVYPLLYRLLRLSREVLERGIPVRPVGPAVRARRTGRVIPPLGGLVSAVDQEALQRFYAAVDALRGLPDSELEMLMFEVIDVLHYRADTWKTALSVARLDAIRKVVPRGIRLGWYGFLGKLRPGSMTGSSDGYIQVPGIEKAATAGLLRSAARRHAASGNAFDVNLSSRRVHHAVKLLHLLQRGLTLREALGMRGERWLHDRGNDLLIPELRAGFVIPAADGSVEPLRVFDGLAVAEASNAVLDAAVSNALRPAARLVRTKLSDDLDALSDLVVAESVHQLALGNYGAANAWIQVLSGDPAPSSLSFTRTSRDGQGSTHRVSLVLDPTPTASNNPREITEPALARLARDLLAQFASCEVSVTIRVPEDVGRNHTMKVRLQRDLHMSPVDLIIGGLGEVTHRARWFTVRRWSASPLIRALVGELPAQNVGGFINGQRPIDVDLNAGNPAAKTLSDLAVPLRRLIEKGRALRPSDMNAGRGQLDVLTETETATLMVEAVTALRARANQLASALQQASIQLGGISDAIAETALEIGRLRSASPAAPEIAAMEDAQEARYATLCDALEAASRFGVPTAVTPFVPGELLAAAEGVVARAQELRDILEFKRRGLVAALEKVVDASSARSIEGWIGGVTGALRAAGDGDGIPVWPPFSSSAKVRPPLDDAALDGDFPQWATLRPILGAVRDLVASHSRLSVWRSQVGSMMATINPTAPARSERERPLSHYFGTYVGYAAGALSRPNAATPLCGVVADEWSELRPSAIQNTALAVNYDAPQSEPPHVLVIGVPGAAQPGWTADDASKVVQNLIHLMQTRAVESNDALFSKTMGRALCVVPPTSSGKRRRRIPTRQVVRVDRAGLAFDHVQIVARNRPSSSADALPERSRVKKQE
jgi:hypothetical protein